MKLTVGQSLTSAVDTTTVIVLRAPGDETVVTCGGAVMRDAASGDGESPRAPMSPPDPGNGTQIGKRYVDGSGALELLCVKPGSAALAADGIPLTVKAAKSLPSSD